MPIHGLSASSFKSKRQSCKPHRPKPSSGKRRSTVIRARDMSMEPRGEKRPYLEVFKASCRAGTSPSTVQNEMRDVFFSTATSNGMPEASELSRTAFSALRRSSFTDICPTTASRADPARYEAMEIRFMKEGQCVRLMPQVKESATSDNEPGQHGLAASFSKPPVQEAPLCKQTVCVEKVDVKNLLAKNREQCGNLGSSRLSEYKQTLLDFSSDDNNHDTTSETKDWFYLGDHCCDVSDDDDSDFDKIRDTTSTASGKRVCDSLPDANGNLVETESFPGVGLRQSGGNIEGRFVVESDTSIDEGVSTEKPEGPLVINEAAQLERKSSFLGKSPINQVRKDAVEQLHKESKVFDKASGIAIYGASKTGNADGLIPERTRSYSAMFCDTSEATTGVSYMTSKSQDVRRWEEVASEEAGKCSDNALIMVSGASNKASTHNLLTDEEITEYKRLALEVLLQRKQATEKKASEKEAEREVSTSTLKSQSKTEQKKVDQKRKLNKDSATCSRTFSSSGKSSKETSSVKLRSGPKKSESMQTDKKKDKSLSLPSSDRSFVASYRRLKKQIQKHKERLVLKHALSKFSKKGSENTSLSSVKSRKKSEMGDSFQASEKDNQASQATATQVLPQAEVEVLKYSTKDKSSSSQPETNVQGNIASIARVSTELNAKILSLLTKSPSKIPKNVAKAESQIETPSISTQGTSQGHDSSLLNTFSLGTDRAPDVKGAKATECKVSPCQDAEKYPTSQAKPVLSRESEAKVLCPNKRCPTSLRKPSPAPVKKACTPSLTKQNATSLNRPFSASFTKQCVAPLGKQCATSLTKDCATPPGKPHSKGASKASSSSESNGSKQSSMAEMVDHFQQTSVGMGASGETLGKPDVDEKGNSKLLTHMELLQSILKSPTAKAAQAVGNYFRNQATRKCISPTLIQKNRDNISVADILSSYQKIFLELGHLSDTENLQNGTTNRDKTCVNASDSLLRSSSNTQKNLIKPSSRRSAKTCETSLTPETPSDTGESTTDKQAAKRTPLDAQTTQSGQSDGRRSPPKTGTLRKQPNAARGHWFRKACSKGMRTDGLRQQREKSPLRTTPSTKCSTLSSTHRTVSGGNLQDSTSQSHPQHIPVRQRNGLRPIKAIQPQQQLATPPAKGSSMSSNGKGTSERTTNSHQAPLQSSVQSRARWNSCSKSPTRSRTTSVFRGIIGRKRQEEGKHPNQPKQASTPVVIHDDHNRSLRNVQPSSLKQGAFSGPSIKLSPMKSGQSPKISCERDVNKDVRQVPVSKHQTESKGHIWNRAFRFLRSRSADRQGAQKSPRQMHNTRSTCSLKSEMQTKGNSSQLLKSEQRTRVVELSPGFQRHRFMQHKNQDGRCQQQSKCVAQPNPRITIIESKEDMPKVESNVLWKIQKSRNYYVKPGKSSSSVLQKTASPRRKESSSSSSLNATSNEQHVNSETATWSRHTVKSATPPTMCRSTKINRYNTVNMNSATSSLGSNIAMREKQEERLKAYSAPKPVAINKLQHNSKKNAFLIEAKTSGPRVFSNVLPCHSPKGVRGQSSIEQVNLQNVGDNNVAYPKKTRIVYKGTRQRQPAHSPGFPEKTQERHAFAGAEKARYRYQDNFEWANSARKLLAAEQLQGKVRQSPTAKRCHSYSGLSAKARRAYAVKGQNVLNKAAVTPLRTATSVRLHSSLPRQNMTSEPEASEQSASSSTPKEKLSLDDSDQEEKRSQEKLGDPAEANVPVPRKWKIEPSDYSSESITPPIRTRSRRDATDFVRAKNGAVSKPPGTCKLLPPKCKVSFRRARSQLSLETLSRSGSFAQTCIPRSRSASYQDQTQSSKLLNPQKASSPCSGSIFSTDTNSKVHGDSLLQKEKQTNAPPDCAVVNRFPQPREAMVSTPSITFKENSAIKDNEQLQGDVMDTKTFMDERAMPEQMEQSRGMNGEPKMELYVVTETLQAVSYAQKDPLANHVSSTSPATTDVHVETETDENDDDSEREIVQSLRENTVEKTCERILWESAQNKKKSSSDSILQRGQCPRMGEIIPLTRSETFDDSITNSKSKLMAMKAMNYLETPIKAKRKAGTHNVQTSDSYGGCQFKSIHRGSAVLTDDYEGRVDVASGATRAESENSKVTLQTTVDPDFSEQDAVPLSTFGEFSTEHDTVSTTKKLTFKYNIGPDKGQILDTSLQKQSPENDTEDSDDLMVDALKNENEESEECGGQDTASEQPKHLVPPGRSGPESEINSEDSSFGPSDAIGTAPPSGVRVYVPPRPFQRSATYQIDALSPKRSLESTCPTDESCDTTCMEICVSDLHDNIVSTQDPSEQKQSTLDVSCEYINVPPESHDNLKGEKSPPKKETSNIGSENVASLRDENSEASGLFPDITSETSSSFNFSDSPGIPWSRSKREDWEVSVEYMTSEKSPKQTDHLASAFATHSEIWTALTEHFSEPVTCAGETHPCDRSKTPKQENPIEARHTRSSSEDVDAVKLSYTNYSQELQTTGNPPAASECQILNELTEFLSGKERKAEGPVSEQTIDITLDGTARKDNIQNLLDQPSILLGQISVGFEPEISQASEMSYSMSSFNFKQCDFPNVPKPMPSNKEEQDLISLNPLSVPDMSLPALLLPTNPAEFVPNKVTSYPSPVKLDTHTYQCTDSSLDGIVKGDEGYGTTNTLGDFHICGLDFSVDPSAVKQNVVSPRQVDVQQLQLSPLIFQSPPPSVLTSLPPLLLPPPLKPIPTSLKSPREPSAGNDSGKNRFPTMGRKSTHDVDTIALYEQPPNCASSSMDESRVCWSRSSSAGIIEIHAELATHEQQDLSSRLDEVETGTVHASSMFEITREGHRLNSPSITLLHEDKSSDLGKGARFSMKKSPNSFKSPKAYSQSDVSPVADHLHQPHTSFTDSYESINERDLSYTSMYATGPFLHQNSPLRNESMYKTPSQAVDYYAYPSSTSEFDNAISHSFPKEHGECTNDHVSQAGQTGQDGHSGAVVLLHPSENVYELYRALSSENAFGRKKPGLTETCSQRVFPKKLKTGAKLQLKNNEPNKHKPVKMEKPRWHSDGESQSLFTEGDTTSASDKSKNDQFNYVYQGTHALTRQGSDNRKVTSGLDSNVCEKSMKNNVLTTTWFDARTHCSLFQLPDFHSSSNDIMKKAGDSKACIVSKPNTKKESTRVDEKHVQGKANAMTVAEGDSAAHVPHLPAETYRVMKETPVKDKPPSGPFRLLEKTGMTSQLFGEKCNVRQDRINIVSSSESVSSCESSTTQGFISSVKFLTAKLMDIVTTLSYPKNQYTIKGRSKSQHVLKRLSTKSTKHSGLKKRCSSRPWTVHKKSTAKLHDSVAQTQEPLGASAHQETNTFPRDSKLTNWDNTQAAASRTQEFKPNECVPNGDAGSSGCCEAEMMNSDLMNVKGSKILEVDPRKVTPDTRNKTDELITETDDKTAFDKVEMGVTPTPCEETPDSVVDNSKQHSKSHHCEGTKSVNNSSRALVSDIEMSKGNPTINCPTKKETNCPTKKETLDAGVSQNLRSEHNHNLTAVDCKGFQALDPESVKSVSMMRDVSVNPNSSLVSHLFCSHSCTPKIKTEQGVEAADQRTSQQPHYAHSDAMPPESNKETDMPASVPDIHSSELTVDDPGLEEKMAQPQQEEFLDVDDVLDTDDCRKQSLREVIYMVVPDDVSQMVQGIYMEEPVLFATPLELQETRNQAPFSYGLQDGPRSHNHFDASDIFTPKDQPCDTGHESLDYSPKPEDRKMPKMDTQDSNHRSSGSPYKSSAAREWRFGSRPRRYHYEHDTEMAAKGKQAAKEKASHHERHRHSSSPDYARFMSRTHTHRFPMAGYRMPMDRNGWYSPDLEFIESTPASDFRTCFNEMDSFSSYQPHVGFFEQDEIGFSQDYDPDTFEELGSLITEFNLSPSSEISTETTAESENNIEREERDGLWWAGPGFTRCTLPSRRSVPRNFVAGSAATTHLEGLAGRRALRRDLAEPTEERKDITFIKQEGVLKKENLFDLDTDDCRPMKTTADEGIQANVPEMSSDAMTGQRPSPLKCSMTQTEKEQELFEKNCLEKVEESQSQISTFMNKCLKTSNFRCYMQNIIAESLQNTLCQFKAGEQINKREENIHKKDEATPVDVTYLSKIINAPKLSSSEKSEMGSNNVDTDESLRPEIANENAQEESNEKFEESSNKGAGDAQTGSEHATAVEDAKFSGQKTASSKPKDGMEQHSSNASRNHEPDPQREGKCTLQASEYRHILASPPKTRRHATISVSARLSSTSSGMPSTDKMTYPIRQSESSDSMLQSVKDEVPGSHLESPSSDQHESHEGVPERRPPDALVQGGAGEKSSKVQSNLNRDNTLIRSPAARKRNRTTSRQCSVEKPQSDPQLIGVLDRVVIQVDEPKLCRYETTDSPKLQVTYKFCNATGALPRTPENSHKSRGEPILLNDYGGTETVSTPMNSPLNCADCSDLRKSQGPSAIKSPVWCATTNQTFYGAKLPNEKDNDGSQFRKENVFSSSSQKDINAPKLDANERRCSCSTREQTLPNAPTESPSPSTIRACKSKESAEHLLHVMREDSEASSTSSMNFDYGNLGDVLSKESKCLWRRITRLESCNDRCKMCLKAYTNITSGAKGNHTDSILKGLCPYLKFESEDAHCSAEEHVKAREKGKDMQHSVAEKAPEGSGMRSPLVENSARTNETATKDANVTEIEIELAVTQEGKANSLKQGNDTKRVNFDIDKNDFRPSSHCQRPGAVMSPLKDEAEARVHAFPTISVSPVKRHESVLENKERHPLRTNLPFPKLPSSNSEPERCGGCCFPDENKEGDEEAPAQSFTTGPKNSSAFNTNLLSSSDVEKLLAQRDQSGCEADKFIKKLFTILQEMQATFPQGNSTDVLGSVLNHSSIQDIMSPSSCTQPTGAAVTPTPMVTCGHQGREKPSIDEPKLEAKHNGQLHVSPPLLLTSSPAQPQPCPLSSRPPQRLEIFQPHTPSPPLPPPPPPPPPPLLPSQTSLTFTAPYQSHLHAAKTAISVQTTNTTNLLTPTSATFLTATPGRPTAQVSHVLPSAFPKSPTNSSALLPSVASTAVLSSVSPQRTKGQQTAVALSHSATPSPLSPHPQPFSPTSTMTWASVKPAVPKHRESPPDVQRENARLEELKESSPRQTLPSPLYTESPCDASYQRLISIQNQFDNIVGEGDRNPEKSNMSTSRPPGNTMAETKNLSELATPGTAFCVPSFGERSPHKSRISVGGLPKASCNRRPPCSRSLKEEMVKMTEKEGEASPESFLKARVKKMVNQIEAHGKVPAASLRNRGRFPETLAIFERLGSPSPPKQTKSLSRELSPACQADNSQKKQLPSLLGIRAETLREKNTAPVRKDSGTHSAGASRVQVVTRDRIATTEKMNKTRHFQTSVEGTHKEQWGREKDPELESQDKMSWGPLSMRPAQAKVNKAGKGRDGGHEETASQHAVGDEEEVNLEEETLYDAQEKETEGVEEDACHEKDTKYDIKKRIMRRMENLAINATYGDDGGTVDGGKNNHVHQREIETKAFGNQRNSGKFFENPERLSNYAYATETGIEESKNDRERYCNSSKATVHVEQGTVKVGDNFGKGYVNKEKESHPFLASQRLVPLDGTCTKDGGKWGGEKSTSLERSNVASSRDKNADKSSNATARSSKSGLKGQLPTVLAKSVTGLPFPDDDSSTLEGVSIQKRAQVPLLEMGSLEELKNFSEEASEVETYSQEQNFTDSLERTRHDDAGFEPSSLCDESYQGETSTNTCDGVSTSTQNSGIKTEVLPLPCALSNLEGRYCPKAAAQKSRGRAVHFLLPETSEEIIDAANPTFSRGSESEPEDEKHAPVDEKFWTEEECIGSRSMIDSESYERESDFPDSRTCSDSTEKLCGLSEPHFIDDLTETSYGEEMEELAFLEEMAEKVYGQYNSRIHQEPITCIGMPDSCFKGEAIEKFCSDFKTCIRRNSAEKHNSCIHQEPKEISHDLSEIHIYEYQTETLCHSSDSLLKENTRENLRGPAESVIDEDHNKKVCSQAESKVHPNLNKTVYCVTNPCSDSGPSKEDDLSESDLHQIISETFDGFHTASVNPYLTQKARYFKPLSHQNTHPSDRPHLTHVNAYAPASSPEERDAIRKVRSSEDSALPSDWTDALSSRPELDPNLLKFSTNRTNHTNAVKAIPRSVPNMPFLNVRTGHRVILPRSPSSPCADFSNTPSREPYCPESGQLITDSSPSDERNPYNRPDPMESTYHGLSSPSFAEGSRPDTCRQGTPSCVLEEFYQRPVVPVKIPLDIYTLPRKVAGTASSGSKKRRGDKGELGPTRTIVISGPINDLSLAVNRHVAQVPDTADDTGGVPQAGARLDSVSGSVYDPASMQHGDTSCLPPANKNESVWMKAVRRIMPFKKRGRADASLHNQ